MSQVCGFGINNADYFVSPKVNKKKTRCPFYRVWSDMMQRVYSDKLHYRQPAYIGCSIAPEWLYFMNFRSWMMFQNWKGNALDKDIIKPGNKIYGPETCCFVAQKINNLLTDSSVNRGRYPQGVIFRKKTGNFQSNCKVNGKKKSIGYFRTPEEASNAYLKFKSKLIESAATEQSDIRVADGLRRHAALLRAQI